MTLASVSHDVDVAIIGLGPTGAIAANLLGQAGLSVYVFDRSHDIYDKPRAIALDHEILRVFQQLGIESDIQDFVEPFTDSVYIGVDGQVIKRLSTLPPPYPLAHLPSAVFNQPRLEEVLRKHARAYPNVRLETGVECLGLEQDADGATLALRDESGEHRNCRARYVIACDGASSATRDQLGLTLDDLGFDEPWLVVDVLINEKGAAKLPTESRQYCHPERPATYLICPGAHRRWEIAINPGEDPQALATPEGTWRLLAPWITPDEGELWRQASYRFHALVAASWRKDRVFIAGDAAHQQPPFLGQGMCQGVRDVMNLCWKLEAVLRGGAPDSLLDSYGEERRGHVRALTSRIKEIGLLISERDPQRARERDARLLREAGGVVRPQARQDVQPRLETGLLGRSGHAVIGRLCPQPVITAQGQTRRLDDYLGRGWQCLLRANAFPDPNEVSAPPQLLGLPCHTARFGPQHLKEQENVLGSWMHEHGLAAVLVRPDHVVVDAIESAEDFNLLFASFDSCNTVA